MFEKNPYWTLSQRRCFVLRGGAQSGVSYSCSWANRSLYLVGNGGWSTLVWSVVSPFICTRPCVYYLACRLAGSLSSKAFCQFVLIKRKWKRKEGKKIAEIIDMSAKFDTRQGGMKLSKHLGIIKKNQALPVRLIRLQRVSTSWALKTSKGGNCKIFLGDLFQCLTIIVVIVFISDLNLCSNLFAVSQVIPSCNMHLALSPGWPHWGHWKAAFRFHWTYFSKLKQAPCPILSLRGKSSSPLSMLMTFCRTCSRLSTSLSYWGASNWVQCSRCLIRSGRQRGITVMLDTTVFLLMQPLLASFAIDAHCRLAFGLLSICKKTNNGPREYLKRIELG